MRKFEQCSHLRKKFGRRYREIPAVGARTTERDQLSEGTRKKLAAQKEIQLNRYNNLFDTAFY